MRARTCILIGSMALLIGLGLGLVYAWFIQPVEYTSISLAELRPEHRATWITLVAASYAVEDDWRRASFRLDYLDDPHLEQSVGDLVREAVIQVQSPPIVRALVRLADRLGVRVPEMMVYLATPVPTVTPGLGPVSPTPSPPPPPTATPTFALPPSPTPLPTLTPTPTPRPGYSLLAQERTCPLDQSTAEIQAIVEDEQARGIPGVEVWVSWDGGADRFVTGLKPELGAGYGDIDIQPGLVYAVSVGNSAVPLVSGLKAEVCPSEPPSQTSRAVWRLTFRTVLPTATPALPITPTLTTSLTLASP
jgi:hypothetical protein